jgi:hypothetical protein
MPGYHLGDVSLNKEEDVVDDAEVGGVEELGLANGHRDALFLIFRDR